MLDKLGVNKFYVAGTSYGGFVAYNIAKILGEEKVEKVIIASSGVNMTLHHNIAMLERAHVNSIDDLMLPTTPQQLRTLMTLAVYKPFLAVPDFFHERLYK